MATVFKDQRKREWLNTQGADRPLRGPIAPDLMERARRYREQRLVDKVRRADCAAILLNAPINIRYALDVTNIQVWALHNPVHYVPMTNRQRGLYARSLEKIEHNLALLRPGLAFADFNELSWRLPERFAAQRYSCAIHGVGMADEWPTVPMHDNDAHAHGGGFATDMTVCVESYIGEVSGPDAIKLETQVLISETGGVRLDSFPFEGH